MGNNGGTPKGIVVGTLEETFAGLNKKQKFFLLYKIIGMSNKDASQLVNLKPVSTKNWRYKVPGFAEVEQECKANAHLYLDQARSIIDAADDTEIGTYLTVLARKLKNWESMDKDERGQILRLIDIRSKMKSRTPAVSSAPKSYEEKLLEGKKK